VPPPGLLPVATIGLCIALLFGPVTSAVAAYSARGSGGSIDAAAKLATPPPPTITSTTSFLAEACLVGLSWTAPPVGVEYSLTRTVGAQKTTVVSNQTSAGTTTDSVLLSQLGGGAPVYTLTSTWIADTLWSAGPSPGATASECLGLL
jgi:hypothetical protein